MISALSQAEVLNQMFNLLEHLMLVKVMNMSTKRKVKLHVVYIEDFNKKRLPVSVCHSEDDAEDNRIFFSANFNHITFVVDECIADDPLKLMNEAVVNIKLLQELKRH